MLLAQSLKSMYRTYSSIVAQSYRKRFRIDFAWPCTHTIIISAFEEYDGLRGIISAGSSFNCTFMKSS
jgi:hypothetical protein